MNRLIPVLLFCALTCVTHVSRSHTHEHRSYEFVPNAGQEPAQVKYSTQLRGGKMFFEEKCITYHLVDNSSIRNQHLQKPGAGVAMKGHAFKMEWVNALVPVTVSSERTSHYYNFFLGDDQSKWKGGVYAFQRLEYKSIYPGISVSYYSNDDEKLKYEYLVSPGFNPGVIQQRYTGGVELSIRKGNLIIKTAVGEMQEQKPVAWQNINGKQVTIACEFVLNGTSVGYNFPKGYNAQYDLIIDPILIFGSYSGSTADNFGMTATYDNTGHLYAGGIAFNAGYPTTPGAWDNTANPVNGSLNPNYGTSDVVITKYLPNGTNLVYSTYLGGGTANQGTETVHSLIVNDDDELYCFGVTSSTNFPTTTGCYDSTFNGGTGIGFVNNGTYFFSTGTDIWVTKFNSTGTGLVGSTFIGGSGNDGVNYNLNYNSGGNWTSNADSLQRNYGDQFRGEVMIDENGNCYIASTTKSGDFPVPGGFQTGFGGKQDAVVFKFNPNLSSLLWGSYIGGSDKDAAYSVKLDDLGNVFVAGGTISSNFTTTAGVLNTTYQGGISDGFLVKINPAGNTLLASTFIGTNSYDQVFFVEIDRFDDVYIYGQTLGSGTYPIVNAPYVNLNSGQFITKLDNNLSGIIYSTLFGNGNGLAQLSPSAFLVDVCGNVYISGWGGDILTGVPLNGMPVTANAFQPGTDGFNFYLAVFERNMTSLLYATYFGGGTSHEHVDGGTSRFDKYGIVYQSVCAGCGGYDDFPTTPGAWSNTNNSTNPSNCNNGVFKFDFEISPEADFTVDNLAGCAPLTITFTNTSPSTLPWLWDFGNGDTTSLIYSPIKTYNDTGTYTVILIVEDSICGLMDTAVKIITVYPELVIVASDTSLCNQQPLLLVASSNGLSPWYVWSSNGNFSDTLNNPVTDSTLLVNVSSDTAFYVQSYSPYCYKGDTVIIDFPDLDPVFSNIPGACAGDLISITATNAFAGQTYTIDWAPDSLIASGDGTATITSVLNYSNWYYVTFTNTDGCSVTDSIYVPVSGPPGGIVTATATPSTISVGMSSQLNATPSGFTYSWFPPLYLNSSTIQNPVSTPPTSMWYVVTVSNNGCAKSDSVYIEVITFICDENYIYVPNAFTPNADGKNDELFVRAYTSPGFQVEIEFKVFDRWGEKVFETTDINEGWDGKFKGRDADPAVFDYWLKATCPGGEEFFKKGNVTLIR